MNSLNNLNLDVTKYSNIELKEILGLNGVDDKNTIHRHIKSIETNVLDDLKIPFGDRNKIIIFLNSAKEKLQEDNNINMIDSNLDLTYGAKTNYLVKDTPDSNPLIHNPNTLASSRARIYEGRGEYLPPGYINPINIKTTKKIINIDSRFRDSYYNTKSSDFHIDLPETYKRVVNMKFISYILPNSVYGVNETNNFFSLYVETDDKSHNIKIPVGNYNIDFSGNETTSIESSLTNLISGHSILFEIERLSGKSKITNNNNGSRVTISFITDASGNDNTDVPLPLKLGWMLGFRLGSYVIEPGGYICSEGIINLNNPKYLYISINDFIHASNNSFVVNFSDSTLSKDIITRINYIDLFQANGPFSYASNDDVVNSERLYYGPVDIKKLHIRILDEYGNVVDLNNMDWSLALSLDLLYD